MVLPPKRNSSLLIYSEVCAVDVKRDVNVLADCNDGIIFLGHTVNIILHRSFEKTVKIVSENSKVVTRLSNA